MIILGTNSIKDTGFDVANSCRFNRGSSDNLTRTMGTATNVKKFTYSFWIKRSLLSSGSHTAVDLHADANNRFTIFIHPGDDIRFYNINGGSLVLDKRTNAKLRDSSAWYHIVCAVDTTQSTAANRAKIYINGILQDSFGTNTIWSQNYTPNQGTSSYTHNIGRYGEGGDTFSGYMSEVVMIDGLQLGADSFGEFDEDSGIWKPIDVSGLTFGTNGFYLDFEDSAALGDDVSGNGNDFTVNNLTAIDQSTDTCTNNFATLNPLEPSPNGVVYSEGNLNATGSGGGGGRFAGGTIAPSSGKWWCEVKMSTVSGSYPIVGIIDSRSSFKMQSAYFVEGSQTTQNRSGYALFSNSDVYNNGNDNFGDFVQTYTSGDIIGVGLDMDAATPTITFQKNGGSELTFTTEVPPSGFYTFPAIGFYFAAAAVSVNFGNPSFSISSGNTDANGYGNFEYAPPSGYYALCTKNLSEFG